MRALILCLLFALAVPRPADAERPEARARILDGIAFLHQFEYEDANEAFRAAQALDPTAVLAYWGEALTYHQALWRRENVDAARAALARLAPTPAARAAKAHSPRERGLLAAVDQLFGDGDRSTRHARYAAAMATLHRDLPDDGNVAALYALALLTDVSRGLVGFSDAPAAAAPALAGSATQREAAAILEQVLKTEPQHPGALHYLLHTYDDPEHARLALDAARRYAALPSRSTHALHMPAHIFLQLGLWRDAVASDRAAFDASTTWVRQKQLGSAMRNYHALSWLQYELLQLGRYREAWQTIAELEPVARAGQPASSASTHGEHQPLLSDLSSMRARYVVETRSWNLLAHEDNFGNVDELCAIGMSAARANNLALARVAQQTLGTRAQSAQEGDLRPAIAIKAQEVGALVDLVEGRREAAVATLRAAAQAELALPAPFGLPHPIKPAPELLGEVLVEVGRPQEAIAAFEQTLTRSANRSAAILGLARAASAAGQPDLARRRYSDLLATFANADADRPELQEARGAVVRTTEPVLVARPLWQIFLAILIVTGVAIVGFTILRSRRRAPRPTAQNAKQKRRKR
jgi:tetratricopeptide (TPR) repeat protein